MLVDIFLMGVVGLWMGNNLQCVEPRNAEPFCSLECSEMLRVARLCIDDASAMSIYICWKPDQQHPATTIQYRLSNLSMTLGHSNDLKKVHWITLVKKHMKKLK